MEVDIPQLELASLNTPGGAVASKQIYELTHHNGVELTPAETYHTEDPSGSIKLTVDRNAHLTHVHIDPRWGQRINPDLFADTLFHTYLAALQRVALLEAKRNSATEQPPFPNLAGSNWSMLSLEETLERANYQLEKINDKIAAINQSAVPAQRPPEHQFSSPQGSLTMTSLGNQPVRITGNTERLQRLSSYQVSTEVANLFELAGAGFAFNEPQVAQKPAVRQRPAQDSDALDDDYFTNFNIDG